MAVKFTDDEPLSDINVVPLVDVVLVVLIIFMVTAPMFMKPSINVNLPKAASGDQTQAGKLNIAITADGRLNLNGSFASDEDVTKKARELYLLDPEINAIISADKDVAHGRVVEVMGSVKSTGVKKFAISIDKK